jgi:hypothetical protein
MMVSKKVCTFQEPVAGKNLVESTRTREERRIVANSQSHSGAANVYPRRNLFDSLQDASFTGAPTLDG